MIYIIRDYKTKFKTETIIGKSLTDFCILKCLDAYLGDKRDLSVFRDENGKPFVRGLDRPIGISVSHSEELFACAIAEENVGLDVQFERKVNYERLSKRYFSLAEQDHVIKYSKEGFFEVWVRKEAYAKYTGAGLKDVLGGACTFNLRDVEFADLKPEKGLYIALVYRKGYKPGSLKLKEIDI